MTLRIGSLFSGAAGLDMAVEAFFGAETAWHCQYDPEDKHQYAAAILAHHYPGVPNHGDITTVDFAHVEPVDILTGGFPCTDVSLAGKRAGLNDETRSGLWAHMARAIAVLNPKLVVIENVRGLLSAAADGDVEPCTWCVGDGGDEPVLRALGAVLADLAGLGFDAEWAGLPASEVGAPHERFRVFILAWPADSSGPRLEDRREGWSGRTDQATENSDVAARGERRLAAPGQAEGGRPRADARGRGGAPAADADGGGRFPAERHVQPGQPDAGRRTTADTESVGRGEGGGPNQRGSSGDLTLPSAAHRIGVSTSPRSASGSTPQDGQLPGQLTIEDASHPSSSNG